MYRIKLYLGYGYFKHDVEKYTYEFTFDDAYDFTQQFLKRFGNTSATRSVEKDRYTVKKLTWNIKSLKDILPWERKVNSKTKWDITIIYIESTANRTEYYHIRNKNK